ncbi:MAG: hypothetical protein IAG10_18705 [Planctomycetaceae bacterium]|nr:hypothetical protein [Planctomycetaceae bacterium]
MAEVVYSLCAVLSIICATLLVRGYVRSRVRFLFWSALCFAGLAVNNILLFVDKVVLPDFDLSLWRSAAALIAMVLLIIGLICDSD